MRRILMVCLGNICRSPLAHGILESKLNKSKFVVDSAGTSAYHIGEPPDNRSIIIAKENNLDISNQRARQFRITDFDIFDQIYAMDRSNYSDILRLSRSESDRRKVTLFLNENPAIVNKNVPDPYYGGADGFKNVYEIINDTCDIISKKLQLL